MSTLTGYSIGETVTAYDGNSALPTVTVTVTNASGKNGGGSDAMGSGVIAAIAVVSVLVVVCVLTAARLHMWWCMDPRCRACFIMKCGRRKPRKGGSWDRRSSKVATRSFEQTLYAMEKDGGTTLDRSPLDRQFPSNSEGESTLIASSRLQEIGGNMPRHLNPPSVVSSVALINTPPLDPAYPSFAVPTSPPPITDPENVFTESPVEGDNLPPSAYNPTLHNKTRSRASHGSGLLSIITLPSFITNDRPRTYSSAAMQLESPVRPHSHHRKQSSSIFNPRFSATNPSTPISPDSDGDTNGKRSRPTSSTLQIITSALRWNSSSSSLRSTSPSSRRSSRRSIGRRNQASAAEDEATIQWRKLPPIPAVQGAMQNRDSQRTSGISAERLPSYIEITPALPFSLAAHIPLPPSPSTMVSSVSSLSYAPPSPQMLPPINGFTTPYVSYLYPPLPSTPGSFSFPPLPPSIPSTPQNFIFPPLPPSIPSTPGSLSFPLPPPTPPTPGKFSYPSLPPSIPSTPGQFIYPPLPPSIPSTPGQFGYPPLPPSIPSTPSFTDKFTEDHTSTAVDPFEINSLRRIPDEVGRTQSDLNTKSAKTVPVFPGNNDGLDHDGTGRSLYRRSGSSVSVYSQFSGVQELAVVPPMPLWTFPSSPPPPMSPRGPRPRPLPMTPVQRSRSGTLHSQTSSNGQ